MKKEFETKSFKLIIKSTSIENNVGKFDGYAAIFNKLDFNNDIILPGAFKRSLDLQGDKRPLYFEHVPHRLLGAGYVEEDETGLKIKGEINLDTQIGREQFSNMQKGYLDTMSIGYMTVSADWIGSTRYLKETALWEVTLTTLPAMPDARVEAKSVVPYQDLAVAPDDTEWDAPVATSRVAEWAGGPDKEKIDWGKYKRAFLWFDEENPTKFGSYKLGIGDIISGGLKAVPKAIYAVAGVLNGARGGVDIPSDDKDKIWNQLQRYYKKMDKEMPEKASLESFEEKIVDETENTIRIRVEDPDKFVDDSFRTIDISKEKGIKAVIGKYKSDPNGSTHVQTYIFLKEKGWTVAKAKEWVKENKNILETLLLETGAKSLLKIEPVSKEADTLSALIEDIKKFT